MKSILIGALYLVACSLISVPAGADQKDLSFKKLELVFEVNETDGDGEVVFSAKTSEGLMWLKGQAPDGGVVIFVNSNDERRGIDPLGISQILLETGEPSVDSVKKAYPEGIYKFLARTVSGKRVYGEAKLSHQRLPAPKFSPQDEKGVDPNQAAVKWQSVKGAAAYEVEVENDDLHVKITARLPGNATQFNIPKGFLLAGTEYEIGVMTIAKGGNRSVAQGSFKTAN